MDQLANFVAFSPLAQATRDGEPSLPLGPGSPLPSVLSKSMTPRLLTQRLNPYFVEHLMGWPQAWTSAIVRNASSAEEMVLFRRKLDSQLSFLLDVQDYLERSA